MQKQIGTEYKNKIQRESFLKDNCDKVEEIGYMKQYTPEELQEHKETLANTSIEISEIEGALKDIQADYKQRLKPLKEQRDTVLRNIKEKSEFVREICYKFVDVEEKKTGYYDSDGELVEERPATASELQPMMFRASLKTGTDD